MSAMPPLPQDFGHAHPALVHFPIACFVCALLFEWFALIRRRVAFGPGTGMLLVIGVVVGVVAIFSGWDFEELVKDGFGPEAVKTLELHEISAIASTCGAFLALVLGLLYRRAPAPWKKIVYLVLLHVTVAAVAYAGALGGSLVWD